MGLSTVRATRSAYTYHRAPIWRVRNTYNRSFAQRDPFGGKVDRKLASNFPLRESCTMTWTIAEIIYRLMRQFNSCRRFAGAQISLAFIYWALRLDPFCASRQSLRDSSFRIPRSISVSAVLVT